MRLGTDEHYSGICFPSGFVIFDLAHTSSLMCAPVPSSACKEMYHMSLFALLDCVFNLSASASASQLRSSCWLEGSYVWFRVELALFVPNTLSCELSRSFPVSGSKRRRSRKWDIVFRFNYFIFPALLLHGSELSPPAGRKMPNGCSFLRRHITISLWVFVSLGWL